MSGFFESYRSGEAEREKRRWRVVLYVALALIAAATLYFVFRNYRETRQAKLFFELLGKKDYAAAYALWGCSEKSPCRDYVMTKFMEDWGPSSPHANLSAMKITKTSGCATGVIIETDFGAGRPDYLWVDRKTKYLGFAPWPGCHPRLP
jgi:hypothetical protein